MSGLRPQNERLRRSDLVPFVVAPRSNLSHLDLRPFGLTSMVVIDPLSLGAAPFLDLLRKLDAKTFGPEGMPMPRWVFIDAAELPGGIVGFALRGDTTSDSIRSKLSVPTGHEGLVPLSMFIAIPSPRPGEWIAHNLASASTLLAEDEDLRGLGAYTKAIGLSCYRTRSQIGATQWSSTALYVHSRLGRLELLSAWTPAHSDPSTLTYRARIDEASLRHLARDPDGSVEHPEPEQWVDSADHDLQRRLQAEIERGARFEIVGRPLEVEAGRLRVPIRSVSEAVDVR